MNTNYTERFIMYSGITNNLLY